MSLTELQILTPTDEQSDREREMNNGYHHLLPRFRQGRISFEVFDRRKRERLDIGFTHDESTSVVSVDETKTLIQPRQKATPKVAAPVTNARARKKGAK